MSFPALRTSSSPTGVRPAATPHTRWASTDRLGAPAAATAGQARICAADRSSDGGRAGRPTQAATPAQARLHTLARQLHTGPQGPRVDPDPAAVLRDFLLAMKSGTSLLHADGHSHHRNYVQQGNSLAVVAARIREGCTGVVATTSMPIPTNLLAQCGDSDVASGRAVTRDPYYIGDPQVFSSGKTTLRQYVDNVLALGPLYYNLGVDFVQYAEWMQLPPEDRALFDLMITGLPLGDRRCAQVLLTTLYHCPGAFSGIGEITLAKEFVADMLAKSVQPDVRARLESMVDLLHAAGQIGMVVNIHCDASDPHFEPDDTDTGDDHCCARDAQRLERAPDLHRHLEPAQPYRNLDGLRALVRACPETTIIWGHMGIGKFTKVEPDHLQQVGRCLDEFPHLNIDISWSAVAHKLLDTFGAETVATFFEAYADRIVFGSDALAPLGPETWRETFMLYHGTVFPKLSDDASHRIRLGNYERLIRGAAPRVRAYEKHVLPHAYALVSMRPDDPALPAAQRKHLPLIEQGKARMREELAAQGIAMPAAAKPAPSVQAPLVPRSRL